MSWESIETKKTCLCGNSTYTVIDRSDDWGRHETHWLMDCPECKKNYSLYIFDYCNSGLLEQGHRWVKTDIYEKAIELRNKSMEAKEKAVHFSKKCYLPVLLDIFNKSSKKEIWKVLNSNIKWYKSLGTFYQHTKGKDKTSYLGELFDYVDLESILRIVNADDEEVNELIKASEVLDSEVRVLLDG